MPAELNELLVGVLGGCGDWQCQQLKSRVHRVQTTAATGSSSVIVKELDPLAAVRVERALGRWLPTAGLAHIGVAPLAQVSSPDGRTTWHVYPDHGDVVLSERSPDEAGVGAAVERLAELHAAFADHPVLADCRSAGNRRYGNDLGARFFESSVGDARRAVTRILARPDLSSDRAAIAQELEHHLRRLSVEADDRLDQLRRHQGPETLLHGDLWPSNILVTPAGPRATVRLIDWERAGVGPPLYDLSALLLRLPSQRRWDVLNGYVRHHAASGLGELETPVLNRLFDTVERARLANLAIWPSLAALEDPDRDWPWDQLADAATWLTDLEGVLP